MKINNATPLEKAALAWWRGNRPCAFDETEHLLLNFREEGSGFAWDDKVPPKPIDIGPKAADVIRRAIAERDRQRKLHEEHLILVDLFEYEGA